MQIHRAAARGDLKGVKFCFSRGVPVDQPDSDKNTPLIYAACALDREDSGSRATLETLRFLLAHGANPNARGWNDKTPIHAAAGACDLAAVELLQSCGADVRHIAGSNYSALIGVAYRPHSPRKHAMMRSLLAQGVSADLETTYGESPLSVSALIGDLDAIELLLGAGANPKPLGWTPIFHAVAFGDFAEIVRLLRKGVDREVRDRWEQTALLFAIKCGDLDKAKLLLDAGFDLAAQARGGRTALQIAAAQNHAALIAWLVDRGILPNDANGFGETPLMAAAEGDSFEAMNVLLERGADPALENHVQSMAVHHASTLRTITRLVQARPEHINAIDGCGEWPLKGAAAANQVALIDGLHALGATIDLTRTGETALHDAIRTDALEAARRLLELGANPNAQDVDGWTPLFSVRSREAAQLLMQFGADPLIGDEVEARASESIDDLLVLELLPKL